MSHLTAEEMVAAIEGTLAGERQAHLDVCDACGMQMRQLAALLREVQAVPVPEPSPLFWDRFSAQVRSTIAATPPSPRLARWFQWPVLAPVGALALLVIALASALPPTADPIVATDEVAEAAPLVLPFDVTGDEEAHWQLMAALLGDVDVDEVEEAGITAAPGTAEGAVLRLSSGEQEELLRLLRQELGQSGG
jgi:hypothetical protein